MTPGLAGVIQPIQVKAFALPPVLFLMDEPGLGEDFYVIIHRFFGQLQVARHSRFRDTRCALDYLEDPLLVVI